MRTKKDNWRSVPVASIQNACNTRGRVLVDCRGLDTGSFSINPGAASLGSFVGTIKQANDPNGTFTALSGVPTITASVFSTGVFACGGYAWLLFDITTAGSSGVIEIDFYGQGSN